MKGTANARGRPDARRSRSGTSISGESSLSGEACEIRPGDDPRASR
ncbi:hypothetical protein A176_006256 [Myxococcus hansupus]|uniref:Uncharacterized protein n=1 Tax=Pseudomyxococcus hansupus TaxID=1297742 RepID=A0A0H4X2F8_9BACT|nr:hypothetical protein A176_006256 [Myxococcus hansupus]